MKKLNNIIIILSFLISLFSKNITLTIILIPLLLVSLLIRKYNKNLELVYLIFLLISYILGFVFDLYNKIYFFDAIPHSLFGIVSAIYALPFLNILKKYNIKNKLFNVIFMLITTLATAAFWEIIEFIIDKVFRTNMQINLNNTMKDIISALLFSILYILIYIENTSKIDKLFITKN